MSNKKFGYARVSTAEQNEDRQVLELLEYGIEERDIYVDKQSGRSFERTNYMSLYCLLPQLQQRSLRMCRHFVGLIQTLRHPPDC